jgi:hypothetical protein
MNPTLEQRARETATEWLNTPEHRRIKQPVELWALILTALQSAVEAEESELVAKLTKEMLDHATTKEQLNAMQRERDEGMQEALRLAECIYRTKYAKEAPNWKPLDTIGGVISQIDNMFAGIRQQRDTARAEIATLNEQLRYVTEQLSCVDCGAAPVEELARRAAKQITALAASVEELRRESRPEAEPQSVRDNEDVPTEGAVLRREYIQFRTERDQYKSMRDTAREHAVEAEAERDPLRAQLAALTDQLDLNRDEFLRIKACPGADDEIKQLCDRSQQVIKQRVPVIEQRDNAKFALAAAEGIFNQITESLTAERDQALARVRELEADKARLEQAVVEIAVPVEVLVGHHHAHPFTEISQDLMQNFFSAMLKCRAVAKTAALAARKTDTEA